MILRGFKKKKEAPYDAFSPEICGLLYLPCECGISFHKHKKVQRRMKILVIFHIVNLQYFMVY